MQQTHTLTPEQASALIVQMRQAVSTVPSYCETQAANFAREIEISPDDLAAHLDDEGPVNSIVGSEMVPVRWYDLPPDQRRAAYCNLYNIYDF